MSVMHVLWFAGSLAVAAAVPGPAVMTTISRVLTHGMRGAHAFCLGLLIGDLVWLWTATIGLGAAASVLGPVLRWGELVGAGYLLVMAWKLWLAEPVALTADGPAARDRRAVMSGVVLQLGNPKTALFYAALVPAIVPITALTVADVAVLSIVVAIVLTIVNLSYVRGAALARARLRAPRALRAIYRISAIVLAATAAAVVVEVLA
jgi:threonine/homoserine/homoserine lactone efflux protein